MHKDYLYWIWLSLCFGPGIGGFEEVLEVFGDPYSAYVAEESVLMHHFSKKPALIERLRNKDLRRAHEIYEFCVRRRVSILTYGDIAYPARLKTIQNPPVLLYYLGTLPALNRSLCIGVVGTRKMSEYGKRMAYKISYELASGGVVIVSGMALGCDAVASAAAIGAHGSTVAVLGSGIDVIYPRQHGKLMEFICQNGAVVTEYPPGTPPSRQNFPIRNRIISGLSQGVLAIEGDLKSGALLTVAHAVKQDRKVFAVPGNVGVSNSEGTNELIRNGATVAIDGGDILEAFKVSAKDQIDVSRFSVAKACSEVDEALLDRLGLMARVTEPEEKEPVRNNAEIPVPGDRRRTPADLLVHSEAKKEPDADPVVRADDRKRQAPARMGTAVLQKPDQPLTKKRNESKPRQTEQKTQGAVEKQAAPAKEKTDGDRSEEILSMLDERVQKIFREMPIDRAISMDRLCALNFETKDIVAALTLLEIKGLISSLPGGLYLRK